MNVNGLGVTRALGRHGVPVIGIRQESDGPELKSRYLREVWRPPEGGGDALVRFLLAKAHEGPGLRPVLLPITDESVEAIAARHGELSRHYRIGMGEPAAVLDLLGKEGIERVAREHGVQVPQTFVVDEPGAISPVAAAIRYPCILKPQHKTPEFTAAGGKKAYRLDTPEELLATYASFSAVEPRVIVQQYVPGGDEEVHFCLAAIAQDGRVLATFTGRKLRQWPPHCGGTAACEPADAPEIAEVTERFLVAAGMRGICGVEFKRDPRDGAFYMIEPTVGRPDWQNGVADANGVPLPYLVYRDLAGLPVPPVRPRRWRTRWVYLNSDRRSADYYRRRGELGRLRWLWSIRPPVRGAFLALDDPAPYLDILRSAVRRAWNKLARLVGRTHQKERTWA
jgi:predicted ATP-grasp superfamily ATP-dependent carboligase